MPCVDFDLDFSRFGDLDLDFFPRGDLDLDFLRRGDLDLDFLLRGDFDLDLLWRGDLDRDLCLGDLDRDLLRGEMERLRRVGDSLRGVTILERHDRDLIGDNDLRWGGDRLRIGDLRIGDLLREPLYGDLLGDRPFLLGDRELLRTDLDRDLSRALGLSRLRAGLLRLADGDRDLDLPLFFFSSGDLGFGVTSFFFPDPFPAEDLLLSLLDPLLLESLSLLLLLLLLLCVRDLTGEVFFGAGSGEDFFASGSLLCTGLSSFGLGIVIFESQRDGSFVGWGGDAWLGSASCSFLASASAAFSLEGDRERDESEDNDLDLAFGASPFWSGSGGLVAGGRGICLATSAEGC